MELTKSVENPSFDGRKRSGYQSQKLFSKGERFALAGNDSQLVARFISADEGISDPKVVAELVASATVAKARNYREIAATLAQPVPAEAALDVLYERGDVDEGKIREAALIAAASS